MSLGIGSAHLLSAVHPREDRGPVWDDTPPQPSPHSQVQVMGCSKLHLAFDKDFLRESPCNNFLSRKMVYLINCVQTTQKLERWIERYFIVMI